MLGRDLLARLAVQGAQVTAPPRAGLDIRERGPVLAAVAAARPDIVVNCAAWTAVDDAEAREEEALRINGAAAGHLAAACAAAGLPLLHVSTDYVFAGDAREPYAEDAGPAPRTAYGRTKLAGERAVLDALPGLGYIVRTAWLYGAGGASFVRTMTALERARETLDVVDDQYGQPTWTVDLADRLVLLGEAALRKAAPAGIYHGTSGGAASWHELAQEIFRLAGADPRRVRRTSSLAYRRPAPRPAYSVLGHDRWREAGVAPIRHWRPALAEAMPALLAAWRDDAGRGA
uniref:dTDP-4-dehydrorhamnose reductase n=1 Tax=Streptomyces versipellis TaxID=67375 RepID=A0A0B6VP85_9ACTN|nr:putative TDP-sugar reductase [Streptomyces versipellis]